MGHNFNARCVQVFLLVYVVCASFKISTCEAGSQRTVNLPWDQPQVPSQDIPPVTADPETLEALVEFKEIVTEGVPLLFNLLNKVLRNKFTKPLFDILVTCDKQNFMKSCMPGIFQKIFSILTMTQQAQSSDNDYRESSSRDAVKETQAGVKNNQAGSSGVKNSQAGLRGDHGELDKETQAGPNSSNEPVNYSTQYENPAAVNPHTATPPHSVPSGASLTSRNDEL